MTIKKPRLKVGHMTYLNSEVFYRRLPVDSCDLVALSPRAMVESVEQGQLAAGPLPTAAIVRLCGSVRPIGNLGVASDGAAMSVLLFSHLPVEQLSGKSVAITSHTVTSVQLLRVLFVDLWSVLEYQFVETNSEHHAALWIGDPALELRGSSEYKYHYDLGDAWKELTGLPFVFAEWVADRAIPKSDADLFEESLVRATRRGMHSIDAISKARSNSYMSNSDVARYVRNFTYFLGPHEREGQMEFERRLKSLPKCSREGPGRRSLHGRTASENAIYTS